jgi:hypothetical protein
VSLYLCLLDGETEIAGVDAGAYADFGEFREEVLQLEGGRRGNRFPTLMNHPDADGQWEVHDLPALRGELGTLADESVLDRFRDGEGHPLAAALLALCNRALTIQRPILFQ